MTHKCLIINKEDEELIQAVEVSEFQLVAMKWLVEELNLEDAVLFIRVDDGPFRFKEI